jgi:outer membrane immunogenic protein
MKNTKLSIIALALSSACIAASAQTSKFTGFFGQVGLGYESSNAWVSEEVFNVGGSDYGVSSSVQRSNGFNLPISVGYSTDLNSTYSLAFGLDYNPNKRTFNVNSSIPDLAYTFDPSTATVKDRYAVYLAPAYSLSRESQVYAKVGYSRGKFVLNDGTGDHTNLSGQVLGLGYKSFINNNLYFYVEGDYTKIKQSSISGSQDVGGSTATYSYHVQGNTLNTMVGLGYKF